MAIISLITDVVEHTGSTLEGPVTSTIQNNNPTFVTIEGVIITSSEDLVDTPSHWYAGPAISKLFHTHSDQVIDDRSNNFVTIEGNPIVVVNDFNVANVTTVISSSQSFVTII